MRARGAVVLVVAVVARSALAHPAAQPATLGPDPGELTTQPPTGGPSARTTRALGPASRSASGPRRSSVDRSGSTAAWPPARGSSSRFPGRGTPRPEYRRLGRHSRAAQDQQNRTDTECCCCCGGLPPYTATLCGGSFYMTGQSPRSSQSRSRSRLSSPWQDRRFRRYARLRAAVLNDPAGLDGASSRSTI